MRNVPPLVRNVAALSSEQVSRGDATLACDRHSPYCTFLPCDILPPYDALILYEIADRPVNLSCNHIVGSRCPARWMFSTKLRQPYFLIAESKSSAPFAETIAIFGPGSRPIQARMSLIAVFNPGISKKARGKVIRYSWFSRTNAAVWTGFERIQSA